LATLPNNSRSSSIVASHLRRNSSNRSGFLSHSQYPWAHDPFPTIFESSEPHSQSGSQSQSRSRPAPSPRQPPRVTSTLEERTISLQGENAEIRMHAESGDHTPGLVESALSLPSNSQPEDIGLDELHHQEDIVEHLEVIDPQVATVSTLANAANAILIPPLSFYSRKPVVVLSSPSRRKHKHDPEKGEQEGLEDMEDSLDRHVEDVLTKRAKFRRIMQGVWSFLKTPMGMVTGIYGFLVVIWGTALVLILVKWINFHNLNTQTFWVEVCSQVECGLFTFTGIGLLPPRIMDTYRITKIWWYQRKTRMLREKAGLPQLYDVDDLPDPVYDPNYVHVLTDKEQNDLHHQQELFRESQTWYRPHGTETHRAFPISMALWICLFVDGNSFFQIILSSCLWSMDRYTRPDWTTGTLIPATFLCGIVSGVLIWRGGKQTRRTEKVEQTLRAALAMEKAGKPVMPQQATEEVPSSAKKEVDALANPSVAGSHTQSVTNFGKEKVLMTPVIEEQMLIPPASDIKQKT